MSSIRSGFQNVNQFWCCKIATSSVLPRAVPSAHLRSLCRSSRPTGCEAGRTSHRDPVGCCAGSRCAGPCSAVYNTSACGPNADRRLPIPSVQPRPCVGSETILLEHSRSSLGTLLKSVHVLATELRGVPHLESA